MAVFCFIHALKALRKIDQEVGEILMEQLEIDQGTLQKWDDISRKMFVPFLEKDGIIEQFEGFDQLKDLDWEKYKAKHGEILRLDRILEKEGDDVKNYKAVKQADVLMLFFLFSAEELTDMFNHMGYKFNTKKQIPATIGYYREITAHGSTLSKVVHSWVYARSHRKESWRNFKKALISDFKDIQGGTTAEGIHLGAMAGTLDLIQRCYTGMDFREDCIFFNPCLPQNVKQIAFRLRYRKQWVEVRVTKNKFALKSVGGWGESVKLMLVDQEINLKKGDSIELDYKYSPSKN
jgi:trehalose/maltose hydrolase-like predicted phosphorylase